MVLFTTRIGRITYLQIVEFEPRSTLGYDSSAPLAARTLSQYSSNATCMTVASVSHSIYVITGEHDRGSMRVVFQSLQGAQSRVLDVPPPDDIHQSRMEPFASLNVVLGSSGHFIVICGTRNGILVTLEVDDSSFQISRSWYDRIGSTSVAVTRKESPSNDVVLVNCDLKIYALTVPLITSGSSGRARRTERKICQIFLTDAQESIIQQHPINSIARLRPNFSEADDDILLISGSQIRLAGLSIQSKPVPRHMPIKASPSRVLYSQHLGCLIVAASKDGHSTLLFIDPDTGEDISSPVDKKNGNAVNFVSALGNFNERIFRLVEWSYVKGGKTWVFIIVCTNKGRIVIISTQKCEPQESGGVSSEQENGRKIRYWTLHKAKRDKPVYSVAGFDEGLIYCSGDILYCEILDMNEKRFKQVAQYVLPSPAVNLTWKEGKIYALTAAHSLEILKLDGEATLDAASEDEPRHRIIRIHGDQVTRNALHHQSLIDGLESPIELVADKSCSVVGLWATHNTRADTLDTVFEAQLPCSILRLRSGRSRPTWDSAFAPKPDMGTLRISRLNSNYQESLGLAIDGSLFSFTILDFRAWRFLRFLVNLAKRSPKVCEFTYTAMEFPLEPALEPKTMMHIDGDILRRCLNDGRLEELLCSGHETEKAIVTQSKFAELLHGLHGEKVDGKADVNVLIEQAYKDLEFFLRPVL